MNAMSILVMGAVSTTLAGFTWLGAPPARPARMGMPGVTGGNPGAPRGGIGLPAVQGVRAAAPARGIGSPAIQDAGPAAPATPEPRFDMPWVEGRGVRARLTFLGGRGETRGDGRAFHVLPFGGPARSHPLRVPVRLRGRLPLYAYGDTVAFELELRNTGRTALRGLRINAMQEQYRSSGRQGPPAGSGSGTLAVDSIEPGASVVLRGTVRIAAEPPPGAGEVGFEQTHVRVELNGPDGPSTLLDAPHAGYFDPPGRSS